MPDQTPSWLLPEALRRDIADWFTERALAVDRCQESAQKGLEMLAERGLLAKGVPEKLGGNGGGLLEMVEVIATVASSCMTSAFVVWCQRMFLEYVATSTNPYLAEEVLPQVLRVNKFGATGLANAMKHFASLEEIRVTAERTSEGYVLAGGLPWVSNLVDNRFVVAVAARSGDEVLLLAVPGDAAGLQCGPRFPLFGLEGTVSASLRLNDVYLDTKWLIARDGITFLKRIRPIFLLLQSGLAWGLAEAALTNATSKLGGPRMALKDQAERLQDQFRHLVEEVRSLARMYDSVDASVSYRALKVRKELAELAVQAVWLELEAAGGAGYLSESATARRLREAAFLPIQSPSFVQLRSELAQVEASHAGGIGAVAGGGEEIV